MSVKIECSRCKQEGHVARDCTVKPFLKPVAKQRPATACHRCKLPGHLARDCSSVPSSKFGRDLDACSVVSTAASTTAAGKEDGSMVCFNCGEVGHSRSRCPAGRGPCMHCGETGHRTAQCTNMVCFECNGKGHLATACPLREERLAREHREYLERTARRQAAAREDRQRRKQEAGEKSSRPAAPSVPKSAAATAPPTPETRPVPELRSSELFPALAAGAAQTRPKKIVKDLDLD